MIYDVLILGGGTAGLAAALYCSRFKLNSLLISKVIGGTGNEAHEVNNWIGEPGISGFDLMKKFINHVKKIKIPLVEEEIINIKKTSNGFTVKTKNNSYNSKTIIYAMGMSHRKLNVPGEKEFSGKGIHYCYTCDSPLYRDKTVVVVGGSDSAVLAALMLKNYAKKIYVIYRKEKLRAEPISKDKIYNDPKIEVIHNTNIIKLFGNKFLDSIKLDNGVEMKVDGVFVEIGSIPNSNICKKIGVDLDRDDFVKVNNDFSTNVSGVFAAGDLTNATTLKQFITSAAQGSIAAQSVYFYLQTNKD